MLDFDAQTKRTILSSIASNFDLFGFNLPILNRARLFMHKLQCTKSINWDSVLEDKLLHEWKLIVRQVNSSQPLEISRSVGLKNSKYDIICCVDASKDIYGCVVYFKEIEVDNLNLIITKNRIVSKKLEKKSIWTLELLSIELGVELIINLYEELGGQNCLIPVNFNEIYLYSDSAVALSWIQ